MEASDGVFSTPVAKRCTVTAHLATSQVVAEPSLPDGVECSGLSCACSSPEATDHTSTAQSTAWLFSGTVPAQQYSKMVSTMHSIIQEHRSRKQKEKQKGVDNSNRSHYQRTPAFILSAVEAALATIAADVQPADESLEDFLDIQESEGVSAAVPLNPPRGGCPDVGPHTGSKPLATTWVVLQGVIKVRRLCCCQQGCVLSSCSQAKDGCC